MDLAGRHVEVEAVERPRPAERLDEARDLDGVGHGRPMRRRWAGAPGAMWFVDRPAMVPRRCKRSASASSRGASAMKSSSTPSPTLHRALRAGLARNGRDGPRLVGQCGGVGEPRPGRRRRRRRPGRRARPAKRPAPGPTARWRRATAGQSVDEPAVGDVAADRRRRAGQPLGIGTQVPRRPRPGRRRPTPRGMRRAAGRAPATGAGTRCPDRGRRRGQVLEVEERQQRLDRAGIGAVAPGPPAR